VSINKTTEIRKDEKYFYKDCKEKELKEKLCFNPLKVSSNGSLPALAVACKQKQVHTIAICYICKQYALFDQQRHGTA